MDCRFGTFEKQKHTDARQHYEERLQACIKWQKRYRFIFDGRQLYYAIQNVGDGYVKLRILKFDVNTRKAVASIKIKHKDLISYLHFPKPTPLSPNMLICNISIFFFFVNFTSFVVFFEEVRSRERVLAS